MSTLSPDRPPADLIDALYEARREERRDLVEAVAVLMDHDDPIVREEAVSLLITTWQVKEFRDITRRMLRYDPDEGVRARAALGLATIATVQSRMDDAMLLAGVYSEPAASHVLQLACLEALSLMVGHPIIAEQDDLGPKAVQRLLDQIATLGSRPP